MGTACNRQTGSLGLHASPARLRGSFAGETYGAHNKVVMTMEVGVIDTRVGSLCTQCFRVVYVVAISRMRSALSFLCG